MRSTLPILAVFALTATGCDTAAPSSRSMAGVWEGDITHSNPSLSGTLTLTVTRANGGLVGAGTWRYPGASLTGSLLGSLPEAGPARFTLDFGDRGMYLHEAALRDDRLTGEWRSARGLRGTISLERR